MADNDIAAHNDTYIITFNFSLAVSFVTLVFLRIFIAVTSNDEVVTFIIIVFRHLLIGRLAHFACHGRCYIGLLYVLAKFLYI